MFAVTRTRMPLADFEATANQLNRLFNEALTSWPFPADESPLVGTWIPPVDILEHADHVRLVAELPGVKPEDVRISLENNILTIRGEKQRVEQGEGEKAHRWERTYGVFERSFSIPATVDADGISARYEQGVLTVTLPKVEKAKPRQISVQVQTK
jgi:HSP20 family protein